MLFVHLWLHVVFTKLLFAIVDTVHAEKPSWTFNTESIHSKTKVPMGTSNDNDWFFSPQHIHLKKKKFFVLSKQYVNIKHAYVSTIGLHVQQWKINI